MVVQKKNEEPQTLEAGLDFWGKQEQKFQSLFGKEALQDKEFLKMKLRYYDSLWYKYKNASLSIEGQLMRNMLKFQRKKLEKSLHHGLFRQVIRRIATAQKSRKALKTQRKEEHRNQLKQYNQNSPKPQIPDPTKGKVIRISKPKRQKSHNHNNNHFYRPKKRAGKGLHH